MSQSSHEESYIYRTYHNVKGLTETNVNDLVVFRHTKYQANFNVIYFGGDVQVHCILFFSYQLVHLSLIN